MGREAVGEVEHFILLAIIHIGADAYGVSIIDEVERRTGRTLTQPAAYLALQRLERKCWITGRLGESTPERGGRAKKFFSITELGREKLSQSGQALFAMWKGQEPLLDADD